MPRSPADMPCENPSRCTNTVRSRPPVRCRRRQRRRRRHHQTHRMRQLKIVEPGDGQHRHRQVQGRIRVRCVKGPAFRRMLENPQVQMQRTLDIRHRRFHVQQRAVGMFAGDRETVGHSKILHCLIIRLGRPELLRELGRREVMVIFRAGGIIQVVQQFRQRLRVPQGQRNPQPQHLRFLQSPERRLGQRRRRNVPVEHLTGGTGEARRKG